VNPEYSNIYSTEFLGTQQCNLIIPVATVNQAGAYLCQQADGFFPSLSAQLVVLRMSMTVSIQTNFSSNNNNNNYYYSYCYSLFLNLWHVVLPVEYLFLTSFVHLLYRNQKNVWLLFVISQLQTRYQLRVILHNLTYISLLLTMLE